MLPRPRRSLSLSGLVRLLRSLGVQEIDVPAEYMESESSDDSSKFIDALAEGLRIAMTAKSRNPTVRQRVDFLGPLNKWLEPVFMAPSHRFLN